MTGCTNPNASNFDPSADQDDGSCVYLHEVQGVRYMFQDHNEESDHSFTLSYSLEGNSWVFYHDYIPDFYFSTRQQLYTLKNNNIWHHNKGPHGQYYESSKKSFYIDVVFAFNEEIFLNSVQWITAFNKFRTITHLTIWNEEQCSGRIELKDLLEKPLNGVARNRSEFSFNDFYNQVVDCNGFLADIFGDFRPVDKKLDNSKPWYEQEYLQGRFFVIRFENDNTQNVEVAINEVGIIGDQTY